MGYNHLTTDQKVSGLNPIQFNTGKLSDKSESFFIWEKLKAHL